MRRTFFWPQLAAVSAPTAERRMKPACRTIGRERQCLEDIAPNNPISEECWSRVSLPPPDTPGAKFSGPRNAHRCRPDLRGFDHYLRTSIGSNGGQSSPFLRFILRCSGLRQCSAELGRSGIPSIAGASSGPEFELLSPSEARNNSTNNVRYWGPKAAIRMPLHTAKRLGGTAADAALPSYHVKRFGLSVSVPNRSMLRLL
jgi:hypothetical protein